MPFTKIRILARTSRTILDIKIPHLSRRKSSGKSKKGLHRIGQLIESKILKLKERVAD